MTSVVDAVGTRTFGEGTAARCGSTGSTSVMICTADLQMSVRARRQDRARAAAATASPADSSRALGLVRGRSGAPAAATGMRGRRSSPR
jgi:hypothetical protein